ncbi:MULTISPECIES: 3-hydroxyacyl-ACP dehydratase FabZ [Vogesella]|jgi:3-hydroxyacyl-[acyl-carrier-protein] dehydratase|uniref:3-hydroxyacyl-[acyl-carrier-protein] dehydratase FabZ n=1 Tax=Vogesella indigofera TaxID=45465 RepID=A0A495BHS0_VOGIN|nr:MULTISPECIES: 3-hydroxyacyl-ACP dehydratase FabZ [Vogesella]KMJ53857.1 3-hydroxyacyl-ACP dehydratase [Vogesella sp. EB]MCQ4142794.1 3-hydroxyacyl-ACP dehydratase FabZ [Vogesella sp. AC12]MDC7692453.1 3-hydroxyacyl-ACP dehydratase FabZ [Vogesella indigofera]MDC7701475.1 3-hydroxyacyl-ACP dehydratase FabZ [Vogesella indigofera]MDC7703662.1 3-hydroxyacyl-ACP dehydratase FabZ [Vogesella indigofera]
MTEAVSAENCAVSIDVREIMRYLPHRYPFLLVDRVTEFEANKRIKALKNVTINEPFFMGHFEQYPVMPGVLIIEALAQAAGILSIRSVGERPENELYFFVGIDSARFKRQVVPGDQLVLEVEQLSMKRGIAKYNARALVDGQVACEAQIMCAKREV